MERLKRYISDSFPCYLTYSSLFFLAAGLLYIPKNIDWPWAGRYRVNNTGLELLFSHCEHGGWGKGETLLRGIVFDNTNFLDFLDLS